jgi:effector-binding domain-containing protein
MKKLIFLAAIIFCSNILVAQTDNDTLHSAAALKEHAKMYQCFKNKDYDCFVNYMPLALKDFVKEKVGTDIKDLITKELDNLDNVVIGEAKTLGVIQSMTNDKVKLKYQKVIESLLEMKIDTVNMLSVSYTLGFSENGTDWTFMRLNDMPLNYLLPIFPMTDTSIRLPKNQMFTDAFIKNDAHKIIYLDDADDDDEEKTAPAIKYESKPELVK